MFVQENPANTFTEIDAKTPFITDPSNGAMWPVDILTTMTTEELAALKIYPVSPFVPPIGYHIVGQPIYRLEGGYAIQNYYEWVPDVIPVPNVISDRQFFQALAMQGTITEQEALDAVKIGAIPTAMMTYINALADGDQFAALMLLSGAVEFHRDHPLVSAFMIANGWTSDQADDLWRFASTL